MANLKYNHPADNIIGNATVTLPTGAADAEYPLTNVRDGDPALPFKATGTSIRIVFDFGAPVSLGLFALIHHNFDAALDVRVQGHTADAWGAPDIDLALTIPSTDVDGFIDNPFLDLAGQAAKRFWSLVNNAPNSANVILGEIWIGSVTRELVHNYQWNARETELRQQLAHRTAYDVEFRYDRGGRRRRLTSKTRTSDAGFTAIRNWARACRGSARSTLIVPDPSINSAWLARWDGEFERTHEFIESHEIPLTWLELSRGLPWVSVS